MVKLFPHRLRFLLAALLVETAVEAAAVGRDGRWRAAAVEAAVFHAISFARTQLTSLSGNLLETKEVLYNFCLSCSIGQLYICW